MDYTQSASSNAEATRRCIDNSVCDDHQQEERLIWNKLVNCDDD